MGDAARRVPERVDVLEQRLDALLHLAERLDAHLLPLQRRGESLDTLARVDHKCWPLRSSL